MRKYLKILALAAAAALILFVGGFANAMLGNPVSKYLAERTVAAHLAAAYPGTDYVVDRVAYSFKDSGYHAFVTSPSSADTYFSVVTDMTGRLRYDSYDNVTNGRNTARRVEEAYRDLTDTVFESPSYPYTSDIAFGTLEIYSQEAIDDPHVTDIPAYTLVQDELEPDKLYDIAALGAAAGHLIVYVDSDDISFDHAAEILLDLRARMDEAGIPFRAIDLHLCHPLPAEGPRPDERIDLYHFAYADIVPDGLTGRIQTADEAGNAADTEK